MCGFSGFIDNIPNKKNVLESMMDEIIHRGPDESGEYIDENAALGFRRLSIIGVSNGLQPLYNEDGSLALVFNGEIYNYQELREDLIKKGHIFKTETDSEVLIHLYEDCKTEMVKKLRGMFAFVIWDKNEKTLFAARDHFGIKPFYYTQVEKDGQKSLIFGSEIKSLLMHPNFKKEVNKHALKPYLTFQYSVLDETFFKGVFKLKPGHFMVYKDGKIKIEQYWDVEFNQENIDLQESINRIKDAVSESVEVHSHSEVPLGSFLSGGVDSSYIAKCLMPQKTFSVGFEQENFDESDLAKDLSDILGIENVRKMITADECFDMLPTIQYHMDEPQSNPSSVPLYFLAQLAREHVTVVLSGEGADEIFGGYEWYDDDEKLKKYKKLPSFIRKPVAKVAEKMPYFKGRTTLIRGGSSVEDYFIGQAQIFEEREAVDILQSPYTKSPSIKEITKPVYNNVKNEDDVTKKQYLDLKLWLAGDILLKADKMSMAHSLEVRVPFLDRKVFDVARTIPTKYKVNDKNTKYAMRMAAHKYLPDMVAEKKKLGFPVPIRIWLKDEKYYNIIKKAFNSKAAKKYFNTSELMKYLDDHKAGKADNSRKIWTVYMFLVWYEDFFGENKIAA